MDIRLFATKASKELNDYDLLKLLCDEVVELGEAITNDTNIEEEVFDVMQMCVNILHSKRPETNTFSENVKHRLKLIKRGHEFIKEGEKHEEKHIL